MIFLHPGDEGQKEVRTALSPPGGLVLAQLQCGSLHTEGSQEYPAAAELEVGAVTVPSWARERAGKRRASMRIGSIARGKQRKTKERRGCSQGRKGLRTKVKKSVSVLATWQRLARS